MDAKIVILLAIALFVMGCVNNAPPSTQSQGNVPAADDSTTVKQLVAAQPTPDFENPSAGDPLTVCGNGTAGEECFAAAVKECHRATASFWTTADNQTLDFESSGLDLESLSQGVERCKIRVYVSADSTSQFAGSSAVCLLARESNTNRFELSDLDGAHCSAAFMQSIVKTSAK